MSRLLRKARQTVFDAVVVVALLMGPVMVHRLMQPKFPPIEPLPPDFEVGLGDEVEKLLREQGTRRGWPQ